MKNNVFYYMNKMEKRKIRIAVSGIKGGTGKSTIAMFLGV